MQWPQIGTSYLWRGCMQWPQFLLSSLHMQRLHAVASVMLYYLSSSLSSVVAIYSYVSSIWDPQLLSLFNSSSSPSRGIHPWMSVHYSGEYACSQWLLFTHILHPCFGVIFVELTSLWGGGGRGQYPIMKNVSLSWWNDNIYTLESEENREMLEVFTHELIDKEEIYGGQYLPKFSYKKLLIFTTPR